MRKLETPWLNNPNNQRASTHNTPKYCPRRTCSQLAGHEGDHDREPTYLVTNPEGPNREQRRRWKWGYAGRRLGRVPARKVARKGDHV